MSEKQYICKRAGEHVECSGCPPGAPHHRNALCAVDDCYIDRRECGCVVCEHAEECDVCSDDPPEQVPSQVRDTIIDSIKTLEATERDLLDAIRGVRISLAMQRSAYMYLEDK